MTRRQEFTTAIKVEIIKRATRDGFICCESCGVPAKRWDIDHVIADGLRIDKSRKLAAADGELLCSGSRDSCHGRKTAEGDVPAIARAKRREAAHVGATRPAGTIKSPGFAPGAKPKRETRPSLAPRELYR